MIQDMMTQTTEHKTKKLSEKLETIKKNNTIQKDNLVTLENACNIIGINRHEMIYIRTAKLDAEVINHQSDKMSFNGQKYVTDRLELTDEESKEIDFNKEKFIKSLDTFVADLEDASISKYFNTNAKNAKDKEKNPKAIDIMTTLQNSYFNGIKIAYLSSNRKVMLETMANVRSKLEKIPIYQ